MSNVLITAPMTPVEKRALQYLIDRAGQAVSGSELGVAAYDLKQSYDPLSEKKYAATVICNIKKKLGIRRDVIKRIVGFGYMYLDNMESADG